jgi:membrane associated rhomboid family serine protease
MGVYDREYYRDEQRGLYLGGGWSAITWLLVVNFAVYLLDFVSDWKVQDYLALRSDLLSHPWNAWQLVTYGFLHAGDNIWHIAFNMFALWMFGRDVEGVYGRGELLRFYLAAVIFSGLAWVAAAYASGGVDRGLIGASGGVTGVLILFVCLFPRRTIYFNLLFPMPAWVLAVLLIVFNLLGAARQETEVAYVAHLGGAAFGFLYWKLRWNFGWLAPRGLSLEALRRKLRRQPRLRVHQPRDDDAALQQRVDEILAKISAKGIDSLSADERRTLEDASRRFQQRR